MNFHQQPEPKQTLNWPLGKQWLGQGIKLFQQMQKHWYATLLLVGIAIMVLSMASAQVAMMALMLAMPLMTAWFYLLCRTQQNNNNYQSMTQLWSSCWQLLITRFNVLLLLGVLAVMLNYLMHAVQLGLLNALQLPPLTPDMAEEILLSEAFLRLLVNILTGLPVALLMAFSPALVMFNGDTPFQAMIRSVKTVLFAWQPILSLTLWLMLLAMAAAFMLSLLMGLLAGAFGMGIVNIMMLLFMSVMMGVVFSANYVTYDALYPVNKNNDNDPDKAGSTSESGSIYKEI
ncbi:hypothetical protein [Marinicella gelatinilytica]|uniref:hypothetical protein n=1 Tax=Marinicella gelatinilytica TaxID=2996017 RepID=UPI0022608F30|nr:hypothetical protein [Marinicella gelatinilytica]MCX7545449.1 hypothetical protein [Marinicella gelatinilytica]